MKKLIILICLTLSIFYHAKQIVIANSNFARSEKTINLYKSPNCSDNFNDIFCLVEKSYFVEIINEEVETYYVAYNGLYGYVKKNDVKKVVNTPETPYPNNIKIVIGSDCNLRSTPTNIPEKNNIITTVKSGENNILFLGRIYTKEAIDFGGTLWYYVKYNNQYGYIYNKYIKSISPIYENTEPSIFESSLNLNKENPLTNTSSLIIVILLFIPFFIILLILYLPRISKNTKIKSNKSN